MQWNNKNTTSYIFRFNIIIFILSCAACVGTKDTLDLSNTYLKRQNGVVINITGNMPIKDKKILKDALKSQIDKNLNGTPKKIKLLGFINYTKTQKAVYDTLSINKSKVSMFNSMVENGYFNADITTDTTLYKTDIILTFNINPKQPYTVKSFEWELKDSSLKPFTIIPTKNDSIIQINKRFTKVNGEAEVARLVNSMRNNGYYNVSSKDFKIEIDTANIFLRSTAIDFEELAQAAKEAKKFNANPYLKYYISKYNPANKAVFKKYVIGNVFIYPNINLSNKIIKVDTVKNIIFNYNEKIQIKEKLYFKNIYVIKDSIFKQANIDRTLFALNKTELWQNIRYEISQVDTASNILDFTLKMTPKLKTHIDLGLDASRNASTQASNIGLGGNSFWGFGLSGSYLNRNVGKLGIKSSSTLSGLLEISGRSRGLGNYNIFAKEHLSIPNFPKFSKNKKVESSNGIIDLNGGVTNQLLFLRYISVELGLGFDVKLKNKPINFRFKPFNVEYYSTNQSDSFDKFIIINPQLASIYRIGFVVGMQAGVSYSINSKRNLTNTILSLNIEESGLTWGGIIRTGARATFLKGDFVAVHNITTNLEKNNSLVFRFVFSMGYEFNAANNAMPIFKKYQSGGPSSMRAWRLRQLGPGSFSSNNIQLTQIGGDKQIELNIEKRWALPIKFLNFKYSTCLFTDIGNSFNNKSSSVFANSSLNNATFFKQAAIALGTGLRIDFNYVLIRLDIAYKLKDPYRKSADGFPSSWRAHVGLKEEKRDFASTIPLPVSNGSRYYIRNYELQFGINYPF